MSSEKENKPKVDFYKYAFWILLVGVNLFIIAGWFFKLGVMISTSNALSSSEMVESFYSSAWVVYTTIFGIFGIVLGIIFPLYNSNVQDKKYKDVNKKLAEHEEIIKFKLAEAEDTKTDLNNFKDKYEKILEDLKNDFESKQTEVQKIIDQFNNSKN